MIEKAIVIGIVGTGVLITVLLMWFFSTYNQRIQRSFRESAETGGTILDISVKQDFHPDDGQPTIYVITYSYYDGRCLREKSFESSNRKKVNKIKVNDKIIVYFDRQNPDNAVTALQIEWEKSMWLYILIGVVVVIVLPVVIVMIFER